MLVLKRKEGQWVEIVHRSGDTLRIRVYNIRAREHGQLDLAFEDDARHFAIERPERAARLTAATVADPHVATQPARSSTQRLD